MEVILKQDVKNLGYKDDVVNVKPGYGRNFLIPKGLADVATVSTKKQLTEKIYIHPYRMNFYHFFPVYCIHN